VLDRHAGRLGARNETSRNGRNKKAAADLLG
jgi:hypothetical protein